LKNLLTSTSSNLHTNITLNLTTSTQPKKLLYTKNALTVSDPNSKIHYWNTKRDVLSFKSNNQKLFHCPINDMQLCLELWELPIVLIAPIRHQFKNPVQQLYSSIMTLSCKYAIGLQKKTLKLLKGLKILSIYQFKFDKTLINHLKISELRSKSCNKITKKSS
jgi:hypothetical protein